MPSKVPEAKAEASSPAIVASPSRPPDPYSDLAISPRPALPCLAVHNQAQSTVAETGGRLDRQGRACFYKVAPKMAEVVKRVDELRELKAFGEKRFPFDAG